MRRLTLRSPAGRWGAQVRAPGSRPWPRPIRHRQATHRRRGPALPRGGGPWPLPHPSTRAPISEVFASLQRLRGRPLRGVYTVFVSRSPSRALDTLRALNEHFKKFRITENVRFRRRTYSTRTLAEPRKIRHARRRRSRRGNGASGALAGASWRCRRSHRPIQLSAASLTASPRLSAAIASPKASIRASASFGQRAFTWTAALTDLGGSFRPERERAARCAARLAFFRGRLSLEPFGRPGFRLGLGSVSVASLAVSVLIVMRGFQSVRL